MPSTPFTILWKQYEPFIQAVVDLFHPFVEAAVHDLKKGKIVALYHNISQRKIGNRSPLKELKIQTKEFPHYFAPYYKQNWDGRPLKCTSITLRDKNNQAIGLICLNVDVSFAQDAHRLLENFLKIKTEAANPIELFGGHCEDQASTIIQGYLDEKKVSLRFLTREQKKEIVQELYRKGIFNYKSATSFIAKKFNISRATVYNHIKTINARASSR